VGSVTSAAYGHTLGRAVALGYVNMPEAADPSTLADAKFELEIADRRFAARGSLREPYDPAGLRVKC
jgi:glycine cleavage system aminomethyltransferase T